MTLVEFRDVSFVHQNGIKALADVNLSVERQELIGIVGENGAGKTTLAKHINGLLKPTTGSVTVEGRDTRQVSTATLARDVGIAFQNPDHQLFSDTVENEITFALKNFGFDAALIQNRLDWALGFFGLEEYRKSSPLILSGGEKKRLTLASVLAWDPALVVLDEPTVGQDMIQKEKLAEIVKMLREAEKTVIIVSHDVEFLWTLQPRLLVMRQGRIVGDGPCAAIMHDAALLENARVTQPQLVQLYDQLTDRPEQPFPDVSTARSWMTRRMA